jgi:hypothetical protein
MRPVFRPAVALVLRAPVLLGRIAGLAGLCALGFDQRAGSLLCGMLVRLAGAAIRVWPMMPIAAVMMAGAMLLVTAAARGLILAAVLLLALTGVAAWALLMTLPVLIGPVITFSGGPAMVVPPAVLSLGPLKSRLRPPEPPDILELRFRAGCVCRLLSSGGLGDRRRLSLLSGLYGGPPPRFGRVCLPLAGPRLRRLRCFIAGLSCKLSSHRLHRLLFCAIGGKPARRCNIVIRRLVIVCRLHFLSRRGRGRSGHCISYGAPLAAKA